MITDSRRIVDSIVAQHAEESAHLYVLRTALRQAPHVSLGALRRTDDRLSAHLDGLGVAGVDGWAFCETALRDPGPGSIFTAAVRALAARRREWLGRVVGVAAAAGAAGELAGAFEWVEQDQLQGFVAFLLQSPDAFERATGLAACALHGVDPGLVSLRHTQDRHPIVRARALRAAGELGCRELLATCVSVATTAEDPAERVRAAASAVLLGERQTTLETLVRVAGEPGPHRSTTFGIALQALHPQAGHSVLQRLATDPQQLRWLVEGSGIVGDPAYVPWLIAQMMHAATARVAAGAFMTVTALDLYDGFERPRPDGFESGPTDDPGDDNVDIDPDEGLPWPDPDKVQRWWNANKSRFQAGERYFMGAPVTRARCIEVLKTGYQRQRILAAHYLCLLDPGTPLFNTSAPAWRQQRLLAEMK
jgi:uncharacterized protein (TIGR02270 family)